MPDQPNNTLYIDALLDGLPVDPPGGKADLSQAYQACGYDATGSIRPLRSIVGQLGDEGKGQYFRPDLLSLGDSAETQTVFAEETEAPELSEWKAKLADDFRNFEDKVGNSRHYAYSLYHFLHAYGSRVAYGQHEDASLFDRNRVLAAVASCQSKAEGQTSFLLVKGAISGIQKYIYHNIKAEQIGDAEKTAKRLRGRSFLVSFINQVIAEYLVEQLGLEQANVLFVGGGHFTLLLPENDGIEEELKERLKIINLGLLENIGPQLSLLTGTVSCGENIGTAFVEAYDKVGQKLEVQKQRRYKGYLTKVFEHFDGQDEKEEKKQRDWAVEEEVRIGTLTPYADYILEVNGSSDLLAQLSAGLSQQATIRSLSFLGKSFFIIKYERDKEREDQAEEVLYEFLSNEQNLALLSGCSQLKIIGLNNTNIKDLASAFSGIGLENLSFGFRFVGKYAPFYEDTSLFKDPTLKPGNVMLFEDLAKLTEEGQTVQNDGKIKALTHQQLGVLRLDMDDLGAVFGHGLGNDNSVERLLCLSREFELFFGGYFNQLAKAHHLYVTYSGGDDAFVIGSWWNTLQFAHVLKQEFDRFTGKNKHLKFSAGLFICNPHYPIPRLAKDAEKLEGKAKAYDGGEADPQKLKADAEKYQLRKSDLRKLEAQKDALHVFNHTLSWEAFEEMMDTSALMLQLVGKGEGESSGSLKRSMIRRFLRIINVHNDKRFTKVPKEDIDFERMRHISALHGLLSRHGYGQSRLEDRNIDKDKTGALIRDMLQKANDHTTEGQHAFEHYTVPFHIALYQSKTN